MTSARDRLVREARAWIGTPFHHQASCRGAGADCLGLVRGVRDAVFGGRVAVPAYGADWMWLPGNDRLHQGLRAALTPVPVETARPGDVLLFRLRPSGVGCHAGLMTEPGRFVHALESAGVVESRLGGLWRARLVAAFAFPGVDDPS